MRTADDTQELPLRTYKHFADRDPLTRAVMDRMLAGVSTRHFARGGEPVGEEVEAGTTSTSKSSVSEMFRERTATAPSELMSRRLDDVRLAVMMLDGMGVPSAAGQNDRTIRKTRRTASSIRRPPRVPNEYMRIRTTTPSSSEPTPDRP
jgi:hypothetical protein